MDADRQNRSPRVEKLPDARLRVSRIYDVLPHIPQTPEGIQAAGLWLDWGVQDSDYTNCRLTRQDFGPQDGDYRKPVDEPPKLIRIFEEIPTNDRVIVGLPGVSFDQYGRKSVEISYIQFAAGTAIYSTVVGGTLGPAPYTDCLLHHFESTNDGTLIRSKYTFIDSGELSDSTEVKYNGKLLVRTIKYLNPSGPPAPAGYTLVATNIEYVTGLQVVGYVYISAASGAGGGGVIDTDTRYQQSSDQGTTGVTVTTIKYLSDPTIVVNPITTPSGMVLISIDQQEEAGYTIWVGVYAKGTGEVAREISYGQSIAGDGSVGTTVTDITHLTASTVSTNPTSAPSGSVLVAITHRESDGYRLWSVRYGKGVGLVVDESTIVESAALVTYHRVALGGAPAAPSPTIGGTVTLFEDSVTNSDGWQIFSRRWAEGDGQSSISTQGQSDGALIYTVVTHTAAASTPAYPGSGTAYLVALEQKADGGYFTNRATYHKPPATVTLSQQTVFENPGTAVFSGSPPQLVITQQVTQTILASMEVSYDTSQVTDTPFSVEAYAALYFTYVPTDTGIAVQGQQALGGSLAGASSISGTGVFNGVDCSAYEAVLVSSIPSAFPGGLLVLHVDNEIYLTAIDGTVVFRRKKVSYTF